MNQWTLVLILLVIFLIGGGGWGHLSGAPWAGTYGTGGISVGAILLIVLIILLIR